MPGNPPDATLTVDDAGGSKTLDTTLVSSSALFMATSRVLKFVVFSCVRSTSLPVDGPAPRKVIPVALVVPGWKVVPPGEPERIVAPVKVLVKPVPVAGWDVTVPTLEDALSLAL